ncbi:MAG: hypothetical protein WBP88_12055 [Nitrososphaeraceae archaeon]|jgi:hypothetical protein
MKNYKAQSITLAAILIAAVGSTSILVASTTQYSNAQEHTSTVVRDSAVVLLGGRTLPSNNFIHLYDTTPYMIMNGHIAAKLPCNDQSESPLKILMGSAPNLAAAEFETIKELSTPGEMCLYHVDVASHPDTANGTITDIALQNPTGENIEFPSTATVVIGVNEIAPIAGGGHEGNEEGSAASNSTESMTMGNSTG